MSSDPVVHESPPRQNAALMPARRLWTLITGIGWAARKVNDGGNPDCRSGKIDVRRVGPSHAPATSTPRVQLC
jgi:hypothetical protein